MELILYKNFKKRINSTKQPSSEGTAVTVELKEKTSIHNPVFILEWNDDIDTSVNYCKWHNDYYYVTDIAFLNYHHIELSCSMDELASHKSEIGNTTAYIEYAADSTKKWLPDKRVTFTDDVKVTSGSTPLFSTTTGTYILGVIGAGTDTTKSVAQVGFSNYWAISADALHSLDTLLFDDGDIWKQITNQMSDAFNCVVECHYVPFSLSTSGSLGFVYLGNNLSEAQAGGLRKYVASTDGILSKELTIPWHYKDWRDLDPYTKLSLWLPFYGWVDIDPSSFLNNGTQNDYIGIKVSLDPIGGEICYGVLINNKQTTYRCDASISVPIGQVRGNKTTGIAEIIGGAVTTIGAVASMVATEGVTAPAAAAAIGGIGAIGAGACTAFKQDVSSKGGSGSFGQSNLLTNYSSYGDIGYYLQSRILTMTAPGNISNIEGLPYYATDTISDHSGYVKCAGASVSIDGFSGDKETINNFINSGIYYE